MMNFHVVEEILKWKTMLEGKSEHPHKHSPDNYWAGLTNLLEPTEPRLEVRRVSCIEIAAEIPLRCWP
jgi:hypothetical protein